MKLKRWEIALMASLLAVFLFMALPISAQHKLSDKLVRLHVVANSDGERDQQLKLMVRDAVLEASQGYSAGDDGLIPRMQAAAERTLRENGCLDQATVIRTRMWFDTREYDTFSLPAGYYNALRVTIGSGEGHNWWCVLFPPLCAGACESDLAEIGKEAGLTDDEIALISEKEAPYVIRFKIVEVWNKLVKWLS